VFEVTGQAGMLLQGQVVRTLISAGVAVCTMRRTGDGSVEMEIEMGVKPIKLKVIQGLSGNLVMVTRQTFTPEEVEAVLQRFREALAGSGIELEWLGPLRVARGEEGESAES
jgi:hypothetical protein